MLQEDINGCHLGGQIQGLAGLQEDFLVQQENIVLSKAKGGSNFTVPENLRVDSPQAQRAGPTIQ
ncbi:hypothetical protein DSO57_1017223 [Entomophthora muscae]|uniref:Uncharacterized protein n=1 Tax=Entomophthora muscae TaxID=34485 RepID=A0ACC2U318_9FUNG|nr:hypothetical protein DSO57_1017223 [Entomophthora muscae]